MRSITAWLVVGMSTACPLVVSRVKRKRRVQLSMRRLLLAPLIIVGLSLPAWADLGPANSPILGETFVDRSTSYKKPVFELYCALWHQKCKVEFTEDSIVVDDVYRVHRSQIIKAWWNAGGRGFYYYLVYQKKDGSQGRAQFITVNTTVGNEFWNRLNLFLP